MLKTLILATVMVSLGAASALAESDQLSAVETPQIARPLFGGGVASPAGSDAYPQVTGNVPFGTAALAPQNGSDGPVQSLASLPRGFFGPTPQVMIASRHRQPAG